MKRRWITLLLSCALAVGMISAGIAYFDFVAQTIYEESAAHLVEIFHQANQILYNLVSVNWSRMRMWAPYLETAQSEADIVAYVEQAREESHFTDFFFISRNGYYITLEGQQGYLNLRDQLADLILDKQPVVIHSVVPGKPEIMVFAIPTSPGSYMGFGYEAIAITYNNSDLVDALKVSAFGGRASTFAVLPDGRVVVNSASEDMQNVHNILALLEDSGSLSEERLHAVQEDFGAGRSGAMVFHAGGEPYYLVYESAHFQDWMVLGIVPTAVVNAGMNRLQSTTMLVVSGITVMLAVLSLLLIVQQNRVKLRQKDKELLARDELFSRLSTNVDDVFLMLDARALRVDYASTNIEELLGITEDEVRADVRALRQLVAPEDTGPALMDSLAGIQPGEQLEIDREYIHRRTGEVRWFHVIAFCSDIQGEKKYILDMSDRTSDRKINQRLEDAVRTAENANRAKTIFLNNMSHDIRTPMNAIVGFTNIAMKHEPKPEVRSCLKKISESADHLLTLINDVLDISRIESGKIRFVPVSVDLTEISDTVLSIMYGFLANRDITFSTHVQTPATPYVLADAVRVREVLVNILGNAVKFTPDGGSITFEASYLPGGDAQHLLARYRVSDTGVGMSEEFVEHIFDEFSQEENGARTQYKGTGLGMAITRRYVDLMGGTIQVESRKGEGSTFVVTLPMELTDGSGVRRREASAGTANLSGVRILLAEDNELNAEIAMVQLEELGMQVTRAADGNAVVRDFAESPADTYDIILMDIMMPGMNGYEATAAIRALPGRPDAASIPIIAMTANAFAEDVQASMDAGMNGHLSKPIVVDEVVKTIAHSLKR